jgi:GGDEF domain-containing protein
MAALKTMCDGVCLSISFGAATCEPGEALKDTVRRADAAMYSSKRATAAS